MAKDALVVALSTEMARIEKHSENWVERMKALAAISNIFEHLDSYAASPGGLLGSDVWRTLRPLRTVVQDLRSQIVKEVCSVLTTIAHATRDAMVPFLRELLPTLVDVRGSGNKVCATYCAECIDTLLTLCVIKGATLRFFVDTLLESKNKMIRLCCISSMKLVVLHWSAVLDRNDVQLLEKGIKLALHDSSASCRTQAYEFFGQFQQKFPKRAAVVLSVVDYKIQKRLESSLVLGATGAGNVGGDDDGRSSAIELSLPLSSSRKRATGGPGTPDSMSVDDDNASANGLEQIVSGPTIELGDRVCIPDKELFGFARYTGEIEGVKGLWIGVELDAPRGKNDGSVKGRYYFRCKPKHGVFARPHQVFLTITGEKLAAQQEKHPVDWKNTDRRGSFQSLLSQNDDELVTATEEDVAVALAAELSKQELEEQLDASAAATSENTAALTEPSPLHGVLARASRVHRKYLDRLLRLVRAELVEHERFETFVATASSADAVQYLQQLQNAAQDKIVLSDRFIQHMIQAQQAARES